MAKLYALLSDIINFIYIQYLIQAFLPSIQNIVGICKQITILIVVRFEVLMAVKIQVEVFLVVTTQHHNPEDLDLKHSHPLTNKF
jgi:hypothetical protein